MTGIIGPEKMMVDETTLSTLGVWVRLSAITGALCSWLKNCIGRNERDDWVSYDKTKYQCKNSKNDKLHDH